LDVLARRLVGAVQGMLAGIDIRLTDVLEGWGTGARLTVGRALGGAVRSVLAERPVFAADCAGVLQHHERGRPCMIRLTVSYPSTEGATFDHDYYRDKHVPLAVKTWGLNGAEIDKGIDGPNIAAVHFKFESLDAMGAAMGAAGTADVLADVANYTSIAPVLQTSEIVE
jgi:uncharacterized protein (TIGR02118 family)